MPQTERTLELLKNFLSNKCTPAELEEVEALIAKGIDDSLWEKALLSHQASFEEADFELTPQSGERLDKIRAEMKREEITKPVGKTRALVPGWAVWSMAASLALLAFFIYLFVNNQQQVYRELQTLNDQQQSIHTSDSSVIWVNNSTVLKYPDEFGEETREVYLNGEAYFQVRKASKPFIVHLGQLDVRVLGTTFNIMSYPDDNESVITLATGKVEVEILDPASGELQHQKIILKPGDQLVFDGSSHTYKLEDVDPKLSYSWKDGIVIFDRQPLGKIFKSIERKFKVKIAVDDSILVTERMTFRQNNDASLEDVIKILSFSGDFKYEIEGQQINIRK